MIKLNCRRPKGLFLIGFTFISLLASAQYNSYAYRRKLDDIKENNYYAVVLPTAVIGKSESQENDLRIYALSPSDTAEIPYVLQRKAQSDLATAIEFERINDARNEKCCSYLTLKFKSHKTVNSIYLDIAEANFDKSILVEGSNDNIRWYTVASRLRIVGFTKQNEKYRFTQLDLPSCEYSYFRIKMDDDGSSPVTVVKATALEMQQTPGDYQNVPVQKKQLNQNKEQHTTELFLEPGAKMPVSKLTLASVEKKDYFRDINIYALEGTYNGIENWVWVGSGVFRSDKKNEFELHHCLTKKLKIEVVNNDNAPVSLDSVQLYTEKEVLICPLETGKNYYLVYGKQHAAAANYDLIHFKDKIPENPVEIGTGAEELINKSIAVAPSPLISDKRWLWLALTGLILLIAYFSWKMLRNSSSN